MRLSTRSLLVLASALAATAPAHGQKPPLSAADVADIVTLEKIEDRRDFDAAALQRIAASKHPELRRRAALAIARLYDPRGRELLRAMRTESDTVVLATVVWATGQLVDTSAVAWLDSLLQTPSTAVGAATEAAGAFGKIRTSDTRLRLAKYLANAAPGANTAPVVEEALLSIGRHRERGDVAPIARWATSPNVELRWRTAWALLRPRDPAGVPTLLELAKDTSGDVRFWAIRGLTGPRADSSGVGVALARQQLLEVLRSDNDRRALTEAVRALSSYPDAASLIQLIALLDSDDMWIATAAAEAIGARGDRAHAASAPLTQATAATNPPWIRAVALQAIADVWLSDAVRPATMMAKDTSLTVRTAAVAVLRRLKVGGRAGLVSLRNDPDRAVRATANTAWLELADTLDDPAVRRAARKPAFASRDVAVRAAAATSMASWADASDIPTLLSAFAVALKDSALIAQEATIETLADIESRGGNAAAAFFAKYPKPPSDAVYGFAGRAFGPKTLAAWGSGRPVHTARTDADYKRIVETLVVPAYNGAPAPRLRWETTRGAVDTELNPLDAPLASDYLLSLTAKGAMRHIRFDRVVPNFVAQQREVLIDEPLSARRDQPRPARARNLVGARTSATQAIPGTRGPGAAYDTGPGGVHVRARPRSRTTKATSRRSGESSKAGRCGSYRARGLREIRASAQAGREVSSRSSPDGGINAG